MPRANSRKRNNHRNATARLLPAASNLSANAPEFVPLSQYNIVNNENQRENSAVQPMALGGCSSEPNSSGVGNTSEATKTISLPTQINSNTNNNGQRDLLINLLNTSKVDCVICYELTKNVEPIWNCRNCFQIMHLKCVMVWFIKSHRNSVWRCPACQNEVVEKPNYLCFCGSLPNPFANNVDTPHSCGQVCGLLKKNAMAEYNDCHHKCTLLCHPGPCPRCVVQVLRKCGCGRTTTYAQCGQSSPIVCSNICSKLLNCKNHFCENQCHSGKCPPCKENCEQGSSDEDEVTDFIQQLARNQIVGNRMPLFGAVTTSSLVSDDELRMLGLNPDELLNRTDDENASYDQEMENDFYYEEDDDDEDNDGILDDPDLEDIIEDIDGLSDDFDNIDHDHHYDDYPHLQPNDDDDDDDVNDDDDDDYVERDNELNEGNHNEVHGFFWSGSNNGSNDSYLEFPFATVYSVNGYPDHISEDNSSNSNNDEPDRSRNGSRQQIATSRNGLVSIESDADMSDVGDTCVPSTSSSSSSIITSSSTSSSSSSSNTSFHLTIDTSPESNDQNDSQMESEASNSSWNIHVDYNINDASNQSQSYSEDSTNSSHHSNDVSESNDSYSSLDTSNSSEE